MDLSRQKQMHELHKVTKPSFLVYSHQRLPCPLVAGAWLFWCHYQPLAGPLSCCHVSSHVPIHLDRNDVWQEVPCRRLAGYWLIVEWNCTLLGVLYDLDELTLGQPLRWGPIFHTLDGSGLNILFILRASMFLVYLFRRAAMAVSLSLVDSSPIRIKRAILTRALRRCP